MSLNLTRQFTLVIAAVNLLIVFAVIVIMEYSASLLATMAAAVLVAGVGALADGLFIRSRIHPLWRLAKAAQQMGHGNLNTPISTASTSLEVYTLANVLEKSRVQLAHTFKELSHLIATMSHEFRTPLTAIKVSIELLLDNAGDLSAAEMYELLNSIYSSVTSLQRLIDNLLESSKIEANHFALRRQFAELSPLVDEATRMMKPLLTRRQQTLKMDVPVHLPMLKLDTTRLVQVMVNLLSNASKYSPMGTLIEIKIEEKGDKVVVRVADQGQGIPPEERSHIFERFIRVEPSSDHGIGLGLWVVRAIIQAHGGQVGVESPAGGGSVFWFTLPQEKGGK